jgi:hypothetical protein
MDNTRNSGKVLFSIKIHGAHYRIDWRRTNGGLDLNSRELVSACRADVALVARGFELEDTLKLLLRQRVFTRAAVQEAQTGVSFCPSIPQAYGIVARLLATPDLLRDI